MDIDNQIITVRINNFNEEHFRNLGYVFDRNDYIQIPVKDLPPGSGIKIEVECSYCHKKFMKSYRRYLETKDKICCKGCKTNKMIEVSIEKYGSPCSLRNPEIQEKSKNKNIKNLGVQYPFQNKDILNKCRETCIKRYGENYRNNCTSRNQIYLNNLYGGILNYNEYPYYLDIFFKDYKIYCEYDGSGHKLPIKLGTKTEEEFMNYEIERCNYLKSLGYKEFRIISQNDILPDDDTLMNVKNEAFNFLLNLDYNHYIYNINLNKITFRN